MASDILNQLQELKPEFKKRLPKNILIYFKSHVQRKGADPLQLINPKQITNMKWVWKPRFGPASLREFGNRHAKQK